MVRTGPCRECGVREGVLDKGEGEERDHCGQRGSPELDLQRTSPEKGNIETSAQINRLLQTLTDFRETGYTRQHRQHE